MKEIAEFREVIRALINASSSPCLEREIRQAYWQETGVNVDAVLLKVFEQSILELSTNRKYFFDQVQDRPSLLTFLKTECSEFCAVVEDGQLVKIYRKSSPKTKHLDHFTRAGERKYETSFIERSTCFNQNITSVSNSSNSRVSTCKSSIRQVLVSHKPISKTTTKCLGNISRKFIPFAAF